MAKILLIMIVVLSASFAFAEDSQTINIEGGRGFTIFHSGGYGGTDGIISYRYNHDWYYMGGAIVAWTGPRNNILISEQLGIQHEGLSLGGGLGAINKTNDYLGTYWQFFLTLRWVINPLPVFIAWNHVSNGSAIFGSPTPNIGENFFNIGYEYKF